MTSFDPSLDSSKSPIQNSIQSSPEHWSPTTQDLLDALPRVWSHGLLYGLIVVVGILLPWASFSKVDETGVARGRIEIKGDLYTKESDLPQPVAATAIHSKEGERVQKGQLLMELDAQPIQDQIQQLSVSLRGQRTRLDQYRLIQSQLQLALRTQAQQNQAQQLEKETQIAQAQQSLISARQDNRLQQSEAETPIAQAKKALLGQQTTLALTQQQLESAQKERDRFQRLYQQGIVPEVELREKEDAVIERLRQVKISQSEVEQTQLQITEQQRRANRLLQQSEADIAQADLQLQEQRQSYQSLEETGKLALSGSQQQVQELESQMAGLQAEIAEMEKQLQAKQRELNTYRVNAPFDGVLQRFPVQKVGTVVSPGQLIAQVAPREAPMIFRAQMPSHQTGFLTVGMPVKLKFDAYPFQDYGIAQGSLSWISPDSRTIETPTGGTEIFDLEIQLSEAHLKDAARKISLSPGQTATAEVIVRQRRVIDFILDPFKKLKAGEFKL